MRYLLMLLITVVCSIQTKAQWSDEEMVLFSGERLTGRVTMEQNAQGELLFFVNERLVPTNRVSSFVMNGVLYKRTLVKTSVDPADKGRVPKLICRLTEGDIEAWALTREDGTCSGVFRYTKFRDSEFYPFDVSTIRSFMLRADYRPSIPPTWKPVTWKRSPFGRAVTASAVMFSLYFMWSKGEVADDALGGSFWKGAGQAAYMPAVLVPASFIFGNRRRMNTEPYLEEIIGFNAWIAAKKESTKPQDQEAKDL